MWPDVMKHIFLPFHRPLSVVHRISYTRMLKAIFTFKRHTYPSKNFDLLSNILFPWFNLHTFLVFLLMELQFCACEACTAVQMLITVHCTKVTFKTSPGDLNLEENQPTCWAPQIISLFSGWFACKCDVTTWWIMMHTFFFFLANAILRPLFMGLYEH